MDNSNGKNVITNPLELKFIQLIATLGSSSYICDPTLLQATWTLLIWNLWQEMHL